MARPRRAAATTAALIAAVVGTAVVFALLPPHPSNDDNIRREATIVLADGHWPQLKYTIVLSALAAGPYRVAEWFGHGDWVLDQFAVLLWVPWALFVGARLRAWRGLTQAASIVAMATISMFAAFVTGFNAEAVAVMLVSAGVLLVLDPRRRGEKAVGAVLAAVGAGIVPVQVVALGVVGVVEVVRKRQWWLLAAAAGAATLVIADATHSTGSLALGKYTDESGLKPILPWGEVWNFHHPIVFGLVGVLFSLGRGLVWFQPGLFLVARTPRPDVVSDWRRLLTTFVFVMVPIYSMWWAWYGGVTFGPRFFLLGVVPAAVALVERIHDRSIRVPVWLVGAGLTVWTGWLAVAGAIWFVSPKAFAVCVADTFRLEPLCWYTAEYSPALSPLWDDIPLDASQWAFVFVAAFTVATVLWHARPDQWWRGHDEAGAAAG